VSSGLRVQSPGDDPQAAGLLVRHKFDQAQITAIQNGAQSAADELNTADSALTSVSTALAQAQALATQMGNDTYTADDRAAAATEVDGIFKQVVGSLNTRLAIATSLVDIAITRRLLPRRDLPGGHGRTPG